MCTFLVYKSEVLIHSSKVFIFLLQLPLYSNVNTVNVWIFFSFFFQVYNSNKDNQSEGSKFNHFFDYLLLKKWIIEL